MTDQVAAIRRHAEAVGEATPPTRQHYLDRVAALAPEILDAAAEMDRGREVPDALQAKLVEAGFFRMLLPRGLGGGEVDPVTFVQVVEALAKLDASVAWCVCQGNGCSTVAAYLDPAVAYDMFGREQKAILAWGPGPAKAIECEGGYRLTGSWSFASGGRHATWLGGQAPVFQADGVTPRLDRDGNPLGRVLFFRAEQAPLKDIWDVVGLRGTGSDAYQVTDLFVPAAYSVTRDNPDERRDPALLYCFPSGALYASGFSCVALGIARALLDSLVALATEKTPRGFKRPLAESGAFQGKIAKAEAQLQSARTYVMTTLERIWGSVQATSELTLEQRMQIRLMATFAIQQAREVGNFAYHEAGATAIFGANPFERRFRDLNTVTQQLQGRESHFETVGQHMLGIEADTSFL